MNTTRQGILLLLKSAVTGETCQLPEDFSLVEALPVIHKHHCGLDGMSPVMLELLRRYFTRMMHSEAQMAAVSRLLSVFEEKGIHHMPLKGTNMKARYPKPELRIMGDADILIRVEQYDSIRSILESLGFVPMMETDHEYVWESGELTLELHHQLIPSNDHEYCAYFGNGWRLAKHRDGFRYAMTPEDEWIHLLTHFAMHYLTGGIGCRHTLDLWVYLRCFPDMDEAYIRTQLSRLRLLDFYDNVCHLLKVWFEGGVEDDRTVLMTDFIFYGHSWKTFEKHLRSDEIWQRRLADAAMAEKVSSYQSAMNYVGLDEHLRE